MRLDTLDSFARAHLGLVNFEAARRRNVSRSSWYRAIASGLFEQLHPNVIRLWGSTETFEQRALAAVWAAGPGALASHRTAARLWGVDRPDDDPLDVISASRSRQPSPTAVTVHRPRDRRDLRSFVRSGVPTTSPMRMLLDLGAVDPDSVGAALQTIVAGRVATPHAVRDALVRHARRGRHGVTALRVALDVFLSDDGPRDSELEARMAQLLAAHDLPPADYHVVVEGFEADFLVRGTRVILECDGWATHGLTRDQFEYDRFRDSTLLAAGYVTVRFTWRQVVESPAQVATRIRDVLTRWSPELLGRTG